MPIPVQFSASTNRYIQNPEKDQTALLLREAMESATRQLKQHKLSVVFIRQLSPEPPPAFDSISSAYNMLLGIKVGDQVEPIGIIDVKALDEKSLKFTKDLANEIVQKVEQHLTAKQTDGILVSDEGAKFDLRALKDHKISIDPDGFLLVDQCRLAIREDNQYWPLQGRVFRSYTIPRFILELGRLRSDTRIRIFDDYDLCRLNKKGMRFDPSKVHQIAVQHLVERWREKSKDYKGGYFLLERDEMSPDTIQNLRETLIRIPPP